MELLTLVAAVVSLAVFVVVLAAVWLKSWKSDSVDVSCWFCGKSTEVPYGNKNCWDCPSCEQYNGFTEDGDYNKPIPAQYSESLNHPVCIEHRSSGSFQQASPTLCDSCNRSQLLKVKQLASFVPYSEANYDMEVESYKYHLEQVYKLCAQCQQKVEQVLATQNRGLEQQLNEYELTRPNVSERSQSAQDSIDNSFCSSHLLCCLSAPWHVKILRMCSVVCALSLFVTSTLSLLQHSALGISPEEHLPYPVHVYLQGLQQGTHLLVLIGLISGLIAIYCFGKSGLHICDAASSITWLCLMAFHSHVTSTFAPEDLYLLQSLLAGLNMVVCLWGWACPRYQSSSSTRLRKMRRSTHSPFSNNSTPPKPRHSITPKTKHQQNHHNIEHDDLERFETMSIGTPSKGGRRRGVFSLQDSPVSGTNVSPPKLHSLSSLSNRKPLISPARFKPSTRATRAQSPSTRTRQLFSANRLPTSQADADDRESLFSEARYHREDSDTEGGGASTHSSGSSLCPVDSTSLDHPACEASGTNKRSLLTRVIVGASIGLNLTLIVYFWLDFKSFPNHLQHIKDLLLAGWQSICEQMTNLWTHLTRENFEDVQEVS